MQDEQLTLQIHFYCAVHLANIYVLHVPRQCIIHYTLHNLPGRKIKLMNLWFSRSPRSLLRLIQAINYITQLLVQHFCVWITLELLYENHLIFAMCYSSILLICFKNLFYWLIGFRKFLRCICCKKSLISVYCVLSVVVTETKNSISPVSWLCLFEWSFYIFIICQPHWLSGR